MSRRAPLSFVLSVAFAAVLPGGLLLAENRLYFESVTAPAGASGVEVLLECNIDQPILGFSFAFDYDETLLTVTSVTSEGTLSAPAPTSGFFAGHIDTSAGRAAYGCVLDYNASSPAAIPAGTGREIAKVIIDTAGDAGGTSTDFTLGTYPVHPAPSPPTECVLTTAEVLDTDGETVLIDGGSSIKQGSAPDGIALLELSAGTLTIEDWTPQVLSVSPDSGLAGEVIEVTGDYLDQPGLAVTVCGVPALVSAEPDGTLLVTVPDCATAGWAPLEVCTTFGCDSEENGFLYETLEDTFVRGNANNDDSVDISDGVGVLVSLFLSGGVPHPCPDALDSNDTGVVDITDAIYIFEFLFLGGPPIPAPFPEPGTDVTPDGLGLCDWP